MEKQNKRKALTLGVAKRKCCECTFYFGDSDGEGECAKKSTLIYGSRQACIDGRARGK